jgi:hypothetical protein
MRPLMIRLGGLGAVSPAGWGVDALVRALAAARPLEFDESVRGPRAPRVRVRRVPKPAMPLPFLRDPRLRRTSPIAQFAVAAALEALGDERAAAVRAGTLRPGIIFAMMNACVNFSRRFYSEVLDDPHTASPLIFPETVFNAPSSHLSALLGSSAINYTLVGDSAQFISALDLAAQWIEAGEVDGCLLVGAEEFDWLSAEGAVLLDRQLIVAEGAAAFYVEPSESPHVHLVGPYLFTQRLDRAAAARRVSDDLTSLLADCPSAILFDSLTGSRKSDAAEIAAWSGWSGSRQSAKIILGDGLGAGAGWQCVAAAASLQRGSAIKAAVSAVGGNEQAVGAIFSR